MYFPYLRARQFELIAIRELATEGVLQNKIIPVFEPVKESFSNLNLANNVFQETQFNPYIIVNPKQGKKSGDTDIFLNYINNLNNDSIINMFLPAFHYSDNCDYINSSINKFDLNDCLLICLDSFSDESNLKELCKNEKITKIMILEPNKYRSLDRYIKGLNKFYIRLDDVFEKKSRNADYLNIQAQKFSEEHLYYQTDKYQGFADFTVLPSEYDESGFAPYAVVIHLTYLNRDLENQIWIRHFTSVSNDSISNVHGKFAEAAQKAVQFCEDFPLINSATNELRKYYEEARYPGLGTIKKISIKNHLLIISNFIKENEIRL